MEPGSEKLVENGDNRGQAIISIAMSLKRLADCLEGNSQQLGLAEHIGQAIISAVGRMR